MKKKMLKVLVLSLLIIFVITSQSFVFGNTIIPYYNSVGSVDSWMNAINGNTLVYGVEVYTSSADKLDYVKIEANLRRTTGAIVHVYSENLVEGPTGCRFTFSKSKTAPSSGMYFRSEEYTSELPSHSELSSADFCLNTNYKCI